MESKLLFPGSTSVYSHSPCNPLATTPSIVTSQLPSIVAASPLSTGSLHSLLPQRLHPDQPSQGNYIQSRFDSHLSSEGMKYLPIAA